jgi:hypothetical protein
MMTTAMNLTKGGIGLALIVGLCGAATATPAQVIILRHGEKADGYKLCEIGQERAKALAAYYLGRGAKDSLLGDAAPAAILAITLHSLELASPAATSWQQPIVLYSATPGQWQDKKGEAVLLNQRTREAAADVLGNPAYDGKTVVMFWEHRHIANHELEAEFAGEEVTFRQLFDLDAIGSVPETWPGDNYDYFWIMDYGTPGSDTPTAFRMAKQTFGAPYDALPANDWDKPNGMTASTGCDLGR